MVDEIRKLNTVVEIPDQIKEIEEKQRQLEHKLRIFNERGISERLEKQTSCSVDKIKLESVLKEATRLKQLLDDLLQKYDTLSISLSGHTSKYNPELFLKAEALVNALSAHMAQIAQTSEVIDIDIESLSAVQQDL